MGAIQPIAEIAADARERGIPFHTDAVQAAGSLPLDVDTLGVDLLSLSAHKTYGPKGVGLLYVRRGTPIEYQLEGGGQEQGRRGGTENVPGIVGLGLALTSAEQWREAYVQHCASLRDRLMDGILAQVPNARINGPRDANLRLPNNLNVSIPGVEGENAVVEPGCAGNISFGRFCLYNRQYGAESRPESNGPLGRAVPHVRALYCRPRQHRRSN